MRAHRCTLSQRKWTSGPEFKIAILLQNIATDPLGAKRRAGASSGRAIAIAVRDGRRGRRGAIYAEDRDGSLGSRELDGGRLSSGRFGIFSSFSSALHFHKPELAHPRAYDDENNAAVAD